MKPIKNYFSILFLVVGVITILEFLFIQGLFTSIMAMLAVLVAGIINVIVELMDKKILYALLYLLATIALCISYIPLL